MIRITACLVTALWYVHSALAQDASALEDAIACASAAQTAVEGQPAVPEALTTCGRALQDPSLGRRDRAATLTNRGLVYLARGEADTARDDFEAALMLMPGLAEAWLGRGNAALAQDLVEQAETDFRRAIELELPDAHVAHYNLGLAHARQGRMGLATQAFEEALRVEPEWPPAVAALDALAADNAEALP